MEPLKVEVIAGFFDEIGEEWLEMFDWCPNDKLPHAQRKTYRLKDLFLAKYRNKICRYTEDRIDDCRTEFHMIFADNRIHALQAIGEIKSLKIMADADMYDSHNRVDRSVNMTNTNNNDDSATSVNKGTVKNKVGALAGTVDAVQLGTVLKEDQRVVDVDQLPQKFDENVRQYNQSTSLGEDITDVTVTDTVTARGTTTMVGTQTNRTWQGIQALNEIRAHSLQLRRIREEMVQCFNVLFY